MALGRLLLSGSPERERFASGRCFARYVVIEDPTQRQIALTALQRWMASSAEAVTGVPQSILGETRVPDETHAAPDTGSVSGHDFSRAATNAKSTAALAAAADALPRSESSNKQAQIGPPSPIPSGF